MSFRLKIVGTNIFYVVGTYDLSSHLMCHTFKNICHVKNVELSFNFYCNIVLELSSYYIHIQILDFGVSYWKEKKNIIIKLLFLRS